MWNGPTVSRCRFTVSRTSSFLFNNYMTYHEKEILFKYDANFLLQYGMLDVFNSNHFYLFHPFNLPQSSSWGFGVFTREM